MTSIAVTPDRFQTEVLQSDKPVVVIVLPIDYGNESDPSDDSIQIYNLPLAAFKSEVEKTVGDQYKVALVDRRYEHELNLFTSVPKIYPPPITFFVYGVGQQATRGFLMGFSKEEMFKSLKNQLSQ